ERGALPGAAGCLAGVLPEALRVEWLKGTLLDEWRWTAATRHAVSSCERAGPAAIKSVDFSARGPRGRHRLLSDTTS
ncbi:hypothetical protein, partial [Burkholderia gladioli]|uniref:hypothetical protein n=1 Tax=Burkholderia gladioli TaxID=28095 RepID=UPI003F7B31E0